MGELSDLPTRPTVSDALHAIRQTHACLEEHREETKAQFASALRWREALNAKLARTEGRLARWGLFLAVLTAGGGWRGLIDLIHILQAIGTLK